MTKFGHAVSLWLLLLGFIGMLSVSAQASQSVCPKKIELSNQLGVLTDSTNQLGFADILTADFTEVSGGFSHGFSTSALWLKVDISLPQDCEHQAWWLRFNIPYHDQIDIYWPQINGELEHWRLGDQVELDAPFQNQRLPHLRLDLAPDQTERLYMRFVSQNALNVSMDLLQQSEFEHFENLVMILSAFFGALILLVLIFAVFNIVLFKTWGYLYYVVFAAAVFVVMMFVHGWANVFWPSYSGDAIATMGQIVGLLALLLLSNKMLNLHRHFYWLWRVQLFAVVLGVLWAAVAVSQGQYRWSLPITHLLLAFNFILLLGQSIWLYRAEQMAKVFVVMFAFVVVAFLLRLFAVNGFIPLNIWTANSMSFALIVQIIILLIGIVAQHYRERERRIRLEAATLQAQQEVDKRRVFMNLLSHELITPLAVMDSGLRNMQEDVSGLAETDQALLSKQRAQIKKMRQLVDTCLAKERFKPTARQNLFSLAYFWPLAQAQLQDLNESNRLVWQLNADEQLMAQRFIRGEADALIMALRLIVNNALKYSQTDCNVELAFDEQIMRVSVMDKGVGFAKNIQAPQAFVRGDNVSHTQGLGIGLTIATELVQDVYAGRLLINSNPQQTIVTLEVPLTDSI